MNWLDWLLGLTLVFTIAGGIMRGFTAQIIGLAASLIGLMLGIWFYGSAGAMFESYVKTKGVASFLGFLVVFFGTLIVGAIVSYAVRRAVKATGLGVVDRMLGGAFGMAKGVLIALAIVTVLIAFAPGAQPGEAPAAITESKIAPYVIETSNVLSAAAPKEWKDEFRARYEAVRKVWGQK